ncbi:hypothetical protein CDAR_308191 [Caerostris darwini]|uniref:Uncharacterized protein n=1 Tax=Caerostris darwini TaxID=1538125 RepID=A0AAV4S876_9ARAC|nr:hypothetical protein CDAR_308191 [Caerostris darwini]
MTHLHIQQLIRNDMKSSAHGLSRHQSIKSRQITVSSIKFIAAVSAIKLRRKCLPARLNFPPVFQRQHGYKGNYELATQIAIHNMIVAVQIFYLE